MLKVIVLFSPNLAGLLRDKGILIPCKSHQKIAYSESQFIGQRSFPFQDRHFWLLKKYSPFFDVTLSESFLHGAFKSLFKPSANLHTCGSSTPVVPWFDQMSAAPALSLFLSGPNHFYIWYILPSNCPSKMKKKRNLSNPPCFICFQLIM